MEMFTMYKYQVIRWKCSPCTNTGTPVVEDAVMSDEDPTPVVEDAVMSDEDPTPVVEDAVMSDEDPILDTSSGFIPMESFRDDQSFHVPEPAIETSLQEDNPTFDTDEAEGPRYIILEGASERGNKMLLDREGYSYTFRKQSVNGNNHWRCKHRSREAYCKATVIQAVDHFRPGKQNHNHPAEPGTHIAIAIKAEVRNNSSKDVFTSSAPNVVEKVYEDLATETAPFHSRPKISNLVRCVNRYRLKARPEDPTEIGSEIDLDFLELNTPNFLRKDIRNNNSRHLLFATDVQLQLLKKCKVLYVDGTFRIVKKPFAQLFSVHGFISSGSLAKQVPLVFCLMSNRSKADYCQIFQAVKDLVPDLEAVEFVADFEVATWQALKEVFPDVAIKGCVFHCSQAVFRKIQENGLQVAYNSRGEAYNFLRRVMALPFLPKEHIVRSFHQLSRSATDDKVCSVMDYIQRQWIFNRVFDVESWSVFMRSVRTNNDVEGWHNRINSRLNTRGQVPFYLLLVELFKEANKLKMDMVMLTEGKISRCQRSRVGQMQTRIFSLWTNYNAGVLTTSGLLRECAYLYGPSADTTPEDTDH